MIPKKRGPQSIEWQAPTPTRIYRDEIEDIFDSLKQISEMVQIETDDYSSIAKKELLDNIEPKRNREVIFRAWRHMRDAPDEAGGEGELQAKVLIGQRGATVWLRSATPELLGILEQIKYIIWRHSRNFSLASIGWYQGVILAFIVISVLTWQSNWALLVAAGILLTFFALYMYLRRTQFCLITLKYRKDDPPFLHRNRDEIVIGIVCSVFGAILGWLLAQNINN